LGQEQQTTQQQQQQEAKRGYWWWRRSAENKIPDASITKDNVAAIASPAVDIDKQNDAYNASMSSENSDDDKMGNLYLKTTKEKYRKTLRLSSDQIVSKTNKSSGFNRFFFISHFFF
jgi:hypothetical protein